MNKYLALPFFTFLFAYLPMCIADDAAYDSAQSKSSIDAINFECSEEEKAKIHKRIFSFVEQEYFDGAKKWINSELNSAKKCQAEYLRLKIDMDYFRLKYQETVARNQWAEVAQQYKNLLALDKRFRSEYLVYLRMAEISNEVEEYEKVFDWVIESLKIKRRSRSYALLIIASYNLGDYKRVESYADQAYSLDPGFMSQVDTMTALSKSYSELGQYQLAKNTLIKLVENNPPARFTEAFGDAVNHLEKLSKESGALVD